MKYVYHESQEEKLEDAKLNSKKNNGISLFPGFKFVDNKNVNDEIIKAMSFLDN